MMSKVALIFLSLTLTQGALAQVQETAYDRVHSLFQKAENAKVSEFAKPKAFRAKTVYSFNRDRVKETPICLVPMERDPVVGEAIQISNVSLSTICDHLIESEHTLILRDSGVLMYQEEYSNQAIRERGVLKKVTASEGTFWILQKTMFESSGTYQTYSYFK